MSQAPEPPEYEESEDDGGAFSADLGSAADVLQRLETHGVKRSRYSLRGEIARGGMGIVLRAWDEDLRRNLAMKVVLGRGGDGSGSTADEIDPKTLGRFLEEAQVTGQLDHPGIVPVHELGLDDNGRVYFTMRLVKGRDLAQIFKLVAKEKEGWSRTRAIWAMLKVCDAMAYAHDKGVIHRDLKPANIMVGRFGEVYVMDWGLARVLGAPDAHDVRPRPETQVSLSIVESDRHSGAADTTDSILYTMDGDVLGTPAYMSPEQARGEIEELGPRSDVYSVGAMLYELLAGQAPFIPPGAKVSAHTVLRWVLEGPPKRVHELNPEVSAELAAICERAMEREPHKRYADMSELAADLRAFLEHRVVKAYATGAFEEFKKWIDRNRGLAAACLVALIAIIAGLGATTYVQAKGKDAAEKQRRIAENNADLARSNAEEAQRQEEIARAERSNVLRLSAYQRLADLEQEAAAFWPVVPASIPAYEAWLARAEELVAGLQPDPEQDDFGHYRQLEALRARALPRTGDEPWRFADEDDRWWHDQLEELVAAIETFADEESGLMRGTSPTRGWGIQRRLDFARRIAEDLRPGSAVSESWSKAIAEVAKDSIYAGLELTPLPGLVPLGRDPDSGLLEFADLYTGVPPQRGEDGRLGLGPDTGLVFVLVPGGTGVLGGQADDPTGENYDLESRPDESPVHEVELDVFLLSKYEMTQGQWREFTARNPSKYGVGSRWGRQFVSPLNPVEQVSWAEATEVLSRMGLALPTEAQWEYAARAGTKTPWWPGEDEELLEGVANLCDRTAQAAGVPYKPVVEWLEDGHVVHAPVGELAPNAFGLHDVHGNVWEWCRDRHGSYEVRAEPGDGERQGSGTTSRVARGGGYVGAATKARSASRDSGTEELRSISIGLRPIRPLRD